MKQLLTFVLGLFALQLSAQEITWSGVVKHADSQTALPFSSLRIQGKQSGTVAGVDGTFKLKLPEGKAATIVVGNGANFFEATITFSAEDTGESFKRDVFLQPRVLNIPETIITGSIDTVFAEADMHVADFVFFDQGMLVLTYASEKHFKKEKWAGKPLFEGCELVWLGFAGEVRGKRKIEPICLEFFQDFSGRTYLRTEYADLSIETSGDFIFLHRMGKGELDNYLRPIVDSVGTLLYVSTFVNDYPAFDYYAINSKDTSRTLLHTVMDEILMVQFKSEYKWLTPRQKLEAFRAEVHYGIEKEIAGAYISGFPNSIYFEELYAPLFVVGKTICVFDHYANHLYKYDHTHQCTDSLAIDYHIGRKSGWEKSLLQDTETDQVYAHFLVNGHPVLRAIDLETGKISGEFALTHTYVEHIRIRDGFAYYTFRPFASSQTRFLYKEQLPEGL